MSEHTPDLTLVRDELTAAISRRTVLRWGAGLTAGVGVMSLLAACGVSPTTGGGTTGGKKGGTMTVGIASPPDTLDPGATGLALTLLISMALFDPLVWWLPDGKGGSKFVPGLAKSYTVNDDATVFTFTLRDDVTFHDGTKFDATAVKATYDHIVDPETQ